MSIHQQRTARKEGRDLAFKKRAKKKSFFSVYPFLSARCCCCLLLFKPPVCVRPFLSSSLFPFPFPFPFFLFLLFSSSPLLPSSPLSPATIIFFSSPPPHPFIPSSLPFPPSFPPSTQPHQFAPDSRCGFFFLYSFYSPPPRFSSRRGNAGPDSSQEKHLHTHTKRTTGKK